MGLTNRAVRLVLDGVAGSGSVRDFFDFLLFSDVS